MEQSPRHGISLQKANEITYSMLVNQFRQEKLGGPRQSSSASLSLCLVAESSLCSSPSPRRRGQLEASSALVHSSHAGPRLPAQLRLVCLDLGEERVMMVGSVRYRQAHSCVRPGYLQRSCRPLWFHARVFSLCLHRLSHPHYVNVL